MESDVIHCDLLLTAEQIFVLKFALLQEGIQNLCLSSPFCQVYYFLRGYIEAIRELEQQLQHLSIEQKFDDIVVACGRFAPLLHNFVIVCYT